MLLFAWEERSSQMAGGWVLPQPRGLQWGKSDSMNNPLKTESRKRFEIFSYLLSSTIQLIRTLEIRIDQIRNIGSCVLARDREEIRRRSAAASITRSVIL